MGRPQHSITRLSKKITMESIAVVTLLIVPGQIARNPSTQTLLLNSKTDTPKCILQGTKGVREITAAVRREGQ